jgi:hypothetical protein
VALKAALEAGWRWPKSPEPIYPTGSGILDWRSRLGW